MLQYQPEMPWGPGKEDQHEAWETGEKLEG